MNSKSGGGSLGTKGCSTCFKISCCFNCAAGVTESFWIARLKPGVGSLPANKYQHYIKDKLNSVKFLTTANQLQYIIALKTVIVMLL